ncbi:MAG: DNA-directed RNA polymerase subunit D [Archaeoglobales archaeon]|nr:MAG: DNA-directed RNA polymerase subunit D [Archaeoglobales archaeon]
MRIEIVEESDLKVKFILRDVPIVLANSLRRAMKSLVPTMAVDYVVFYMNTSFLYDEIIAHRIGLIPIKTNLDRFNMPGECVCGGEGCPNCQVSFRLNVEGPKVIYSGDLISEDPEIKPVYDNIPIVELFEGQQLMIEAVARLGIGKEHAKYQPVSSCYYKIIPEIVVGDCSGCGDCVEVCPRDVLKMGRGVEVGDVLRCSMCMECVKVCEEDAIKVLETNNYLFFVEGTGSLPVREVMKRAVEALKRKAEEMNDILKEIV